MQKRIIGLDLARAFAFFGMVLVNFKLVMTSGSDPIEEVVFFRLIEGRAAATFVVLAGVGLSLLAQKHAPDHEVSLRNMILKRGLLLFVIGLAYTPIWPADILHFYGLYFIIAAFCLFISNAMLWLFAVITTGLFVIMLLALDYTAGWNFESLTYLDFWSFEGMIRHLFFNGFHPVFPWLTFVWVGLWLGRQNLAEARVRRRIGLIAMSVYLSVEIMSRIALGLFAAEQGPLNEDMIALLGTAPMPPMPQFLIAGASLATAFICFIVELGERFQTNPWTQSLAYTGQMSLSHYVAHVLIGMGILEAFGLLSQQPLAFSMIYAGAFICLSVAFSAWWAPRFGNGPLERLFRLLK